MPSLKFRPDWDAARERLTTWWNGGDIGRAVMRIVVKREQPWEVIPALPTPEGWVTDYSTKDFAYRIYQALSTGAGHDYYGEAVPAYASGDLAPNCLALYLGCRGVEMPGTVWVEPCFHSPQDAHFTYDPNNFYWQFSLKAYREVTERGRGKMLQQFPDLIEGLDTLAAMRGTIELLEDMLDRPEWVQACLREITDRYFRYYDVLYDIIRDETGGSVYWGWAPGRTAKFQCDMSAMLSPAMFTEFMAPVLTEMTERVSYAVYHLDGPDAVCHVDTLLTIPRLHVIQWSAGAGVEYPAHARWWPMFHRILDAGKKVQIGVEDREQLLTLKREFGAQTKQMLLNIPADNRAQAEEYLQIMVC